MSKEAPLLDIGAALKKIREEKVLSQNDIFKVTGIDRNYVSRIERGEIKYPKLGKIKKLADALGVTVDEFINLAVYLARDNEKE